MPKNKELIGIVRLGTIIDLIKCKKCQVTIDKQVHKILSHPKKLPLHIRNQFQTKIEQLRSGNISQLNILHLDPKQEQVFRIAFGDYRIIFRFVGEPDNYPQILIVDIGTRQNMDRVYSNVYFR